MKDATDLHVGIILKQSRIVQFCLFANYVIVFRQLQILVYSDIVYKKIRTCIELKSTN